MTRPPAPLIIGAAVIGLAAVAATAPADSSAVRTCHGLRVTISASKGEVHGTPHRDIIALTGAGHVEAGAGNDIICGSSKADVIDAGPGADVVVGRAGADRLDGGPGADRLFGDRGNDQVVGGDGADYLMGGAGRDTIVRGNGRAGGQHQQQLGDTIVPGTQAISLNADRSALVAMSLRGDQVGIGWDAPDVPGQLPLPIAWALLPPFEQNVISLDRPLMGYVSTSAPYVEPGMWVRPTFWSPVVPGQSYSVNADAASTLLSTGGGSTPRQVQLVNAGPQSVTAGLARQAWVNGWGLVSPITAVTLYSQEMALLSPPTQPVLFVSPLAMVGRGELLDPVPTPNITVAPAAGSDTVTVSLHYANGSFSFSQDD